MANKDLPPRSTLFGYFELWDYDGTLDGGHIRVIKGKNIDGGVLVLGTLFGRFPFLKKLFADGGYQGPVFCPTWKLKSSNDPTPRLASRLPRRWVVERTFAWLNYENRRSPSLPTLRKLCLNT